MIIPESIVDGSYFESERYWAKRNGLEIRESEDYGTIYVDDDYNEFVKDEYGRLVPLEIN